MNPLNQVARRKQSTRYMPPEDVRVGVLSQLLGGRAHPSAQAVLGFAQESAKDQVWYAGDEALVRGSCVAVVGTRNPTRQGAARARRLARELVEASVVVVSGLAMGIDTEALSSAIEAGGRVIAVIGTPLDKATPAANSSLQERIYRDHLLVSPFEPGSRIFPANFPRRNRLMAAMSDATAIVEAGEKSGTLHQAAECRRLDRWLFLARSLADNAALTWPAKFLKYDRTAVLDSTDDILQALPPRNGDTG